MAAHHDPVVIAARARRHQPEAGVLDAISLFKGCEMEGQCHAAQGAGMAGALLGALLAATCSTASR